jgi:hypothetical protein
MANLLAPAKQTIRASRACGFLVALAVLTVAAPAKAVPGTLRCDYREGGEPGPAGNRLAISGTDNALVRREGDLILVGTTEGENGPRGFEEIACSGEQATVANLDRIIYSATPPTRGSRQFILDEREGLLTPGATPEASGSEIEIELGFARGDDHPPHVQVLGTEGPDQLSARPVSRDRFGVNLNLRSDGTSPDLDLRLTAPPAYVELKLHGEQGSDRIDARPADAGRRPLRSILLAGDEGGDTLLGTKREDHLEGGSGADRLLGRGGRDYLYPSAGRDRSFGGAGNDWILSGSRGTSERDHQPDFYSGGSGNDYIVARVEGRDTIRCGSGFDKAYADRIDNFPGNDCEDLSGTAAGTR